MQMSKIDPDKIANMNEISINLECPIDLMISLNPLMCSKCFNLYCEDCSTSFKKCPTCNSADYQMLKTTNTAVEYEINRIKIYCENRQYGCTFTGFIGDVNVHSVKCPYSINLCSELNCGLYLSTSNFSKHYIEECNGKRLKCYICGSLESFSLMRDHLKKCSQIYSECNYCGLYHIMSDIEKCRFKLHNCMKCNFPDIKKDLDSGEHVCFIKGESIIFSSISGLPKSMSLSTYYAGILNKVEKLLENNLQLKDETYTELINSINSASASVLNNLGFYLKSVKAAKEGEITNALQAEFIKMNSRKESINKQIVDQKLQLKKIKTNLDLAEGFYKKAAISVNSQFKLQLTQKNVNLTILQDALLQQQDLAEESVSQIFEEIENNNIEISQLRKVCDICTAEAFNENVCQFCNKLVCSDNCSVYINDTIVCLKCLKCSVCNAVINKGAGTKCFSDKCNNFLCSDCFRVNMHQVRNKNSDCKFTKCKECDKSGICIMTSRHCPECSIRLCYKCYSSNHLSHNSKNRV